jgi:hypothetical protein
MNHDSSHPFQPASRFVIGSIRGYPSSEEMQRAGVITSESFGERFAASGALLRGASREDPEKVIGNLPGFRAIKEIAPATHQKMVTDFSAAILSGKYLAEAQNAVSAVAQQVKNPGASSGALTV